MKTFDIDDPGLEFIQGIRRCGAFVYRVDISEGEKKMKTFDKKDVYSWSNAEEARQYIGQKGYMADSSIGLQEAINISRVYELKDIDEKLILCFYRLQCNYGRGLFLPVDKVKEVEEPKKWRAFKNLDDLKTYANKSVGSVLVYRKKNKDLTIKTSMITNYVFDTNCISLGNLPFSFETLFDEYEWLNEYGIWQPFGVLDESEV